MSKLRGNVLLSERTGAVLTLTINRPDATNAIDSLLREELRQAFDEVAATKQLRAVVLTSAGEDAFSVGMDIAEIAAYSPQEVEQVGVAARGIYERMAALEIRSLRRSRVPVWVRGSSLRCMRMCGWRGRMRALGCRGSMSA